MGRSLYRHKGDVLLIVVAGALCAGAVVLPFMAGHRIVRWSPTGKMKAFFRTVWWLLLATLGAGLFLGLSFIVFYLINKGYVQESELVRASVASAIPWTLWCSALAMIAGLMRGLFDRRQRKRAHSILLHNQAFLDAQGIRDMGGKSVTHVDGAGNKLTLDHIGEEIIEFTVPGSSRKRAYIHIGPDGRFESYTGLVEA
ncbi:MAG: hypothetical protein J0H41_05150 [Rhizobiales bacterium]|nr:hypothetical protein [Hyphomicrobiales bacterium]